MDLLHCQAVLIVIITLLYDLIIRGVTQSIHVRIQCQIALLHLQRQIRQRPEREGSRDFETLLQ